MARWALALAVLLVVVASSSGTAAAAGVGLAPAGCVRDAGFPANGCSQSMPGIRYANDLALSPAGDSLYVASFTGEDVAQLRRAPDGSLTPGSCIQDAESGRAGCPTSMNGLREADAVAAADDAVFVGSFEGLAQLSRGADGSLTPFGCMNSFGTCGARTPALGEVDDLALSPGGDSLYTVSATADAVATFARGPGPQLTFGTCFSDTAAREVGDPPASECPQRVDGLKGGWRLAASPDGRSVYAVSTSDNALVRFDRGADGSLTYAGCIDDNDTGPKPCAQSVDGMDFAVDVAVSGDGKSVYVVSYFDQAVVRFNRAPDGSLTPAGCVENRDGADNCAQGTPGMTRPWAVEVSPNGDSVYVAAIIGDGIFRFARTADGALAPAGCVADDEKRNKACAVSSDGLDAVDTLAASPDGRSLYAGSWRTSVVIFRRDLVSPNTSAKGPKTTTKRKATFKVSSSEPGSKFECAIDNPAGMRPCTATFTTRTLGYRAHVFYARAIDPAGNPDETPVRKAFKVVRPR